VLPLTGVHCREGCQYLPPQDRCQRNQGAAAKGCPEAKKPHRRLADATDVALSSISRNLDVLGDEHWRGGPRLGLVAKDWDPRESRRMVAWLAPKGKQVVSRLLESVAP
jgi:hypothetical protein